MIPERFANNPETAELWETCLQLLKDAGKWRDEYLARFCDLVYWMHKVASFQKLALAGDLPETKRSRRTNADYPNPKYTAYLTAVDKFRSACDAFGMTPASDAKLKSQVLSARDMKDMMAGPQLEK